FLDGSEPDVFPVENVLDIIINDNSPLTHHNIEVTGGTDKVKYYTALGYLFQKGMWATTNSDRFNLSMNLDAEITNTTTISVSINGRLQNAQRPPTDLPTVGTSRIMETIGYAHVGNTYGGPAIYSNGMYGYHLMANIFGSGYYKENSTDIYSQISI